MADVKWHLKGRNFSHCNCSYGCPCQFNALPTHGNCEAVVGIVIDEGNHGGTKLDGLMFGGVFSWPGPIHEGHGQAVPIVDERASPAQREAILRIMSDARKARFIVPNVVESRGERQSGDKEGAPRAVQHAGGFEFTLAEVGRGWAKTNGAIKLNLADSHAHFAELNITGTGVIR
jgi:hypothetical protein